MKNNKHNFKDIIFLTLLITSLFFLINPLDIIMVEGLEMIILGFSSLLVIAMLIFLWKEDPIDERDETHLLIAGRISFFSTAVILLLALIVQTLQHNIDVWVPVILSTLLCSKVLSIIYLKYRK